MITKKRISWLYILETTVVDFIIVLLLGLAVYCYKMYIKQAPISIPSGITPFLGTAISILLSFKISQSYGRWWEARKIWGAIVNDSRSFVIQLQSYLNKDSDSNIKKMAHRQIAFCYSLGQSLRGLNPMDNIDKLIDKRDYQSIETHHNKPLALLQKNALDVKTIREKGDIDIFSQTKIDDTITRLTASMGKAERIKGTVFPTTYRLNLHISIYIFLICLTITLTNISVFYGLPLVLIIGTLFFMLEGAAYNLQDPFENRPSDTAVTAIARTIEINIRELLGEEEIPEPLKAESFYLM